MHRELEAYGTNFENKNMFLQKRFHSIVLQHMLCSTVLWVNKKRKSLIAKVDEIWKNNSLLVRHIWLYNNRCSKPSHMWGLTILLSIWGHSYIWLVKKPLNLLFLVMIVKMLDFVYQILCLYHVTKESRTPTSDPLLK